MNKPKYIIIHCSDSHYGNRQLIDEWHKQKGWDMIGYHYVITNAYPTYKSFMDNTPSVVSDGMIVAGRPEKQDGAHAYGYNTKSIGVCLIGTDMFTGKQLISLRTLVKKLQYDYGDKLVVLGHYETKSGMKQEKTCPNINMNFLRDLLEG